MQLMKPQRDLYRCVVHLSYTFFSTEYCELMLFELLQLMKSPSTPQRFWLPLLHDSVDNQILFSFLLFSNYENAPLKEYLFVQLKLLNWPERSLLNVTQTNLMLNKLQELSIARLRPGFIESELSAQAVGSVRLALATNLGRAFLEECQRGLRLINPQLDIYLCVWVSYYIQSVFFHIKID